MAQEGAIRKPFVYIGLGVLAVGLLLMLWGLAPVRGFAPAMEAINGQPPDDLAARLDAAMAGLAGRAWASGLGLVLLMGGIIALKSARRPAKSVEQQVEEAVEARLAARHAEEAAHPGAGVQGTGSDAGADTRQDATAPTHPASVQDTRAPPDGQVGAVPKGTPLATGQGTVASTPGRCPTCNGILVAGGRICAQCGRVA